MKSAMKHIFTVLLLLFCVSCISDRETRAVLDQVEVLIEENPAEAYELVKGIDGAAISSSAVNARYALLYTKAEYKNYIDAPTDSLISIAADYYERHGSDQEKFYAYLYQGCVNYGIKDYTSSMKAVDVLLKANDYVDAVDNYKDVGLMYIQLSTLYGDQQSSDEEICARKAYEAYEKAGLELHKTNAMMQIASAMFHKGEYVQCYNFSDSILVRATILNDTVDIVNALVKKVMCAVWINRLEQAHSIYSTLLHNYGYSLDSQDYSHIAIIKASQNNKEEVDENIINSKLYATTFNDTVRCYIYAAKAYELLHVDSLSYVYKDSALIYENRLLEISLKHTALAAQKEYAEYKLENAKLTNRQNVLMLVLVILLLSLLVVLVFDYARRQTLLTKLQAERITNLIAELDKNRKQFDEGLDNLRHSQIVAIFQNALNKDVILHELDWKNLDDAFHTFLPTFEKTLLAIHELTEVEWRVCMLIKLGFSSSEIAKLVNKSATAIPSIRSRLYAKCFLKKGRAADWDTFIESI